jgi:aspartyl-tRNA(Asn)/glutamyl-tRNA(Gln) amidotransferase subunit C
MKISKAEVVRVADLARLAPDEAAIDRFAGQIDTVLAYVDMLKEADTQGVSPTSHAVSLSNAFREDAMKTSLDREGALANAPERDDENFVVPRVIG